MRPLRPFPLPLNVGIDICQISRIYGIIDSPRASRLVNRILSPEERDLNSERLQVLKHTQDVSPGSAKSGKPNPLSLKAHTAAQDGKTRDPNLWKCAVFLAGRFAAKEAAIKAHAPRKLTLHNVMIERMTVEGERLGSGPPVARIRGEEGAEADDSAAVSISHDGDYATAVCLGARTRGL